MCTYNMDTKKPGRPKGSRSKSEPPLHKLQRPHRTNSCAPANLRNPAKRSERIIEKKQVDTPPPTPSTSAESTRFKARNFYLVENSIDGFSYSKLPKTKAVLRRILEWHHFQKVAIKTAIKQTVSELRDVWKYHFGVDVIYGKFSEKQKGTERESRKIIIPTAKIEKKVRELYDAWKEME